MNSIWESRNVWLPMEIDDDKGTLEVVWHDIFDLNVWVWENVRISFLLATDLSSQQNRRVAPRQGH